MTEKCAYCQERVIGTRPLHPFLIHKECLIRMTVGSSAHQLRLCSCFGGNEEDPTGEPLRVGARRAYETFLFLRSMQETTMEQTIQ